MQESKDCDKIVYEKLPNKGLYKQIKKKMKCLPKIKKRCEFGKLKYDDPKTNRKKGEPCKDDREG